MIRSRLISAADDPTELWQVEYYHDRRDPVPAGFGWVKVKPSFGFVSDATLVGVVVATGQVEDNGIANDILEDIKIRWPGYRRIREPAFRP